MFVCVSTEVSDIIGLKAQDPLEISLILEHAFMHTELSFQKLMLFSIYTNYTGCIHDTEHQRHSFIICVKLLLNPHSLLKVSILPRFL